MDFKLRPDRFTGGKRQFDMQTTVVTMPALRNLNGCRTTSSFKVRLQSSVYSKRQPMPTIGDPHE